MRRRPTLVAALALAFLAPSARAEEEDAAARGPVRLLGVETFGGIHASDYSTVRARASPVFGVEGGVGVDLVGALRARVDGVLGGLDGTPFGIGAGRMYVQTASFALGGSYTRTMLGAIASDMMALHAEIYEHAWLSVVLSAGVEKKDFGDDLGFGEVLFRIYPTERFLLSTGLSYAVSDLKQTRGDILAHAEYAVLRVGAMQAALYAEYGGNLLTRAAAGLVVYFDAGSYAARERRDALWGARLR